MCAFRLDAAGRLIIGSMGSLPAGGGFRRAWAGRMVTQLFPHLGAQELEHAWAGQLAFTRDHLPRLHYLGPRLVTCIGYNGRGIGPGTFFGKALAEHLLGAPPETLPLPVSEPSKVAFSGLRSAAIEAFTRAWHFRQSRS